MRILVIIHNCVWGFALYGGPAIPFIACGVIAKRRSLAPMPYRRTFILLTILHLCAFAPYLYGVCAGISDPDIAMVLPLVTSVVTGAWGIALLLLSLRRGKGPVADVR